jgi:hypothetical protein
MPNAINGLVTPYYGLVGDKSGGDRSGLVVGLPEHSELVSLRQSSCARALTLHSRRLNSLLQTADLIHDQHPRSLLVVLC